MLLSGTHLAALYVIKYPSERALFLGFVVHGLVGNWIAAYSSSMRSPAWQQELRSARLAFWRRRRALHILDQRCAIRWVRFNLVALESGTEPQRRSDLE
jgi:hypothetical protein